MRGLSNTEIERGIARRYDCTIYPSFEGECQRQAMTQVPSMNEGLFTVVTETSATFRLEYEDDYEYESKVLSTRTSKILGLQA